MGTLEDVRKMFQDFLAPELRAIDQKLKNMEQGHTELRAELKDFRNEVKAQFEKADERLDARFKELFVTLNLEARVRRIEDSQRSAPRPDARPDP
jgi:predicted transcriptional regulator